MLMTIQSEREPAPELRKERFKEIRQQVKRYRNHENATFVYGLVDPETKVICYYGKCKNPASRFSLHTTKAQKNGHHNDDVNRWVQRLASTGNLPHMRILCVIDTPHSDDLDPVKFAVSTVERRFIERAADCHSISGNHPGGPIANVTHNPRRFIP